MDEKGLPSNCEERVKICKKILDVAESYGIEKKQYNNRLSYPHSISKSIPGF